MLTTIFNIESRIYEKLYHFVFSIISMHFSNPGLLVSSTLRTKFQSVLKAIARRTDNPNRQTTGID